jgi:predicted esterase
MNHPIVSALAVLTLAPATALVAQVPPSGLDAAVIRSYVWPSATSEFTAAAATLSTASWAREVDQSAMDDLAEILREGPPALDRTVPERGDNVNEMVVELASGRRVPLWIRLPSDWTPDRHWPLMFAMHGGPPGSVEAAVNSGRRMISVWAEAAEAAGWIVASPAMVDVVSREGRTDDRLPYEIFQPEEAREVVEMVRRMYRVNPDRIVSTGISLGSNFSIAYAAAYPDWLSGIVPVSTEGESREHLLRNVANTPAYVLEGSQDQNIRGVNGPRSMRDILTKFGNDLVYREFGDRAHEGFSEHYPDVLSWLDARPRQKNPTEILRVPHAGISGTSRTLHWIESRDRQGVIRAGAERHEAAVGPNEVATTIHIEARWTGGVRIYLNDQIADLDRPVRVIANGSSSVHYPTRSIEMALEIVRTRGDERLVFPVSLDVDLPTGRASVAAGETLWSELAPTYSEGVLSFWEMYAVRALQERFPNMGFSGTEVGMPLDTRTTAPEQVALRVDSVSDDSPAAAAGLRRGDVLLNFGGEPFFRGRGGVTGLYHWLVRELRTHPQSYELIVWRDGERMVLAGSFSLGPYSG